MDKHQVYIWKDAMDRDIYHIGYKSAHYDDDDYLIMCSVFVDHLWDLFSYFPDEYYKRIGYEPVAINLDIKFL